MATTNHIKQALDEFTTTEFTFRDRESYIVWRKEWRERYLRLSQMIRKMKYDAKEAQMRGFENYSMKQARLAFQRSLAFHYMEQRMAAKALCKEQREANSYENLRAAG